MSASDGPTTGIQTTLYVDRDFATAAPTYAQLTTASTGLVIAGNLVKDAVEIGDQAQTGNTAEYTPYGAKTSKRIAIAASLDSFVFAFVLDNSNSHHNTIKALGSGDAIQAAVRTATDTSEITIDYLRGEVISVTKSTPVDNVQQITVEMSLEQAPLSVDQS